MNIDEAKALAIETFGPHGDAMVKPDGSVVIGRRLGANEWLTKTVIRAADFEAAFAQHQAKAARVPAVERVRAVDLEHAKGKQEQDDAARAAIVASKERQRVAQLPETIAANAQKREERLADRQRKAEGRGPGRRTE